MSYPVKAVEAAMSTFKGETHHPAFPRLPLLVVSLLILLSAIYGGLVLMGWRWPSFSNQWLSFHGPLLVAGFLGILIGLERAVNLGRNWIYLGPIASALGAAWLLAGFQPAQAGKFLLTLASILWLIVTIVLTARRPVLYHVFLLMGSACWLSGNLLWLSYSWTASIPLWWACFLTLNFAAMRIEILRILHLEWKTKALFAVSAALAVSGALWTLNEPTLGTRISSAGLTLFGVWFLLCDSSQRKDAPPPQALFEATCLKTSYVWLIACGAIGLFWAPKESGPVYDAFLHTLFLGYIFCLSCAHVFRLNETIVRKPLRFRKTFWIQYWLLNLSLLLRILCDLIGWVGLARWAGLLNALAVLAFLLNWALGLRRGHRQKSRARAT